MVNLHWTIDGGKTKDFQVRDARLSVSSKLAFARPCVWFGVHHQASILAFGGDRPKAVIFLHDISLGLRLCQEQLRTKRFLRLRIVFENISDLHFLPTGIEGLGKHSPAFKA